MQSILTELLTISIAASVMIGIVLIIRALFSKRMSAVVMPVLWAVVLVRLCLPFTIESPVNVADLFPAAAQTETQSEADAKINASGEIYSQGAWSTTQNAAADDMRASVESSETITDAPAQNTSPTLSISLWNAAGAIWLTGIAVTLLMFFIRAHGFKNRLRRCADITDAALLALVHESCASLGIKQRIRIKMCDMVDAPAVCGLFSPVILIPGSFVSRLDSGCMNAILLHELYHIKHADILKNYIWLAAKAVHWFNPLVYIAYKKYEDDVELIRDELAARKSETIAYSQSLVAAARLLNGGVHAGYMTASLLENKGLLRNRITRLLCPKRKSRTITTVSLLLAVITAVACFTTACQPTPEKEIVAGKNGGVLEEKLEATPGSSVSAAADFPAAYKDSYTAFNGQVITDIDAAIKAQKVATPAYTLTKKSAFSEEEVSKIIKALYGENELTSEAAERSQKELEAEYLKLKKEYEDKKNGIGASGSEGGSSLEDYEKMLSELEMQISSAPESVGTVKVTAADYVKGSNFLYAHGASSSGEQAQIRITGADIEYLVGSGYYCSVFSPVDSIETIDGLSISKQDAIAKAEQTVKAMGISDMAVSGMGVASKGGDEFEIQNATDKAYCVCFMRTYNSNLTFPQGLNMPISDETYAEPMLAESLQITVNDNGVAAVAMNGACELKEETNSNIELADFEQIVDRFKTQISSSNAYFGSDESTAAKSQHFNVSSIQLGYVEIQQKNSDDTLLIPAWTFYGTDYIEFDEQAMKAGGTSEESIRAILANSEKDKNTLKALMTINAVDGSMVR